MVRTQRNVALVLLLIGLACLPALGADRRPASPWIGVQLGPRAEVAEGEDVPPGVVLAGIVKESPADRAGLRARDRVLAVDGVRVESPERLIATIRERAVGDWVRLTIRRGESEREIGLRLAERTRGGGGRLSIRQGWIGIDVIELPEKLSRHFGVPEGAAVMVADIAAGSPAAAAGFELGDVIYEVDGEPAGSAAHLGRQVGRGGVGNTLVFTVLRAGAEMELEALLVDAPEGDPFRPAR